MVMGAVNIAKSKPRLHRITYVATLLINTRTELSYSILLRTVFLPCREGFQATGENVGIPPDWPALDL